MSPTRTQAIQLGEKKKITIPEQVCGADPPIDKTTKTRRSCVDLPNLALTSILGVLLIEVKDADDGERLTDLLSSDDIGYAFSFFFRQLSLPFSQEHRRRGPRSSPGVFDRRAFVEPRHQLSFVAILLRCDRSGAARAVTLLVYAFRET